MSAKTDSFVTLSIEELSRLAGVGRGSVQAGGKTLKSFGLASSKIVRKFGKFVTGWTLKAGLSGLGSHKEEYFYFPMRFVYGGNWSHMPGSEKCFYLAVGGLGRTYKQEPTSNPLLKLLDTGELDDLHACYDQEQRLRLACVSYREIQYASGLSQATVKRIGSQLQADASATSIIRAYPAGGGRSLLYHLRDHAEPVMPFGHSKCS